MALYCTGCIYWRCLGGIGGVKIMACHWALDNPPFCRLQPAEHCTYKLTKKEANGLSKKFSDEDAKKLYNEGKSDREMGKAFGVNANSILYWRRKHNLNSNEPPRGGRGKKTDMAMEEKTVDELPAEVCNKVEAAMAGKPEPEREPEKKARPAEADRSVCPEEYDPLVFEAFDQAVAWAREHKDMQVSGVWRKLLAAVERHMAALRDYMTISESATYCVVQLAAAAAVGELEAEAKDE